MRKIKLLLCTLVVILLASCSTGQQPVYDITDYLEAFKTMDYSAMWELTDPAVNIKKEDFINKYDAIFSGLGVEEIVIDNLAGPDEDGYFTYSATYKTKEYGDFTNNYTLKALWSSKGSRVFWNYSLIFPEMEAGSTVRVKTLKASRGEIFAADGTIMAQNAYADTVYMDASKVQDITAVTAVVCPVTGLTQTEVVEMFNKAQENGTQIVALKAFPANTLTEAQRQSIAGVTGLGIDDMMYTPIRYYPFGESAAHIVGYMGYMDEENLPEGYTSSDKVGVSGLESAYDSQLRGKDGKIVYIEDKWGENVRTLWEKPMEEGQDLRLTIKPALQQTAYDALKTNLKMEEGQSGIAIVMDAATGDVEAMASYPSFDNNVFSFSLADDMFNYLFKSDYRPLLSLPTQGLYPPGSVIKPFTATAALEGGAITPETAFEDEIVENKWYPKGEGWSVTRIDDSAGTPLQLANALRSSDNIFFAYAALQLGDEKLMDYFKRIGFEQGMPFDLPVKESNIINIDTIMSNKLLADMGYGQGELTLAPIQLAAMYTAFANGTGDIMRPILVKKLCRTEGLEYVTVSEKQKEAWIENAVSEQTLETLSPMLKNVVDRGTGHSVYMKGVPMAGKTGTAEIGENKSREASWFACYWLDGWYDRLVIVMVDVAAEKGPVKFEIAKALLAP